MLVVSSHVRNAGVASRDVPFAWDEWSFKSYYLPLKKTQLARLDRLTNNASLALTLASGEWIVERFSLLTDETIPLQILEAGWAGMVHPAYALYYETDDDAWRGPILGPLAVVINVVNDAIFCLDEDPRVAVRACWMQNLARHVLPVANAFDVWFDASVDRLNQHHSKERELLGKTNPFNPIPLSGLPVPRETFDPKFPYDLASAPQLLDAFLRELRPEDNPYLRSSEELMSVPELDGHPYRYHR